MSLIKINNSRCKSCYLCVATCPKGLIKKSNNTNRLGDYLVEFDYSNELNEEINLCDVDATCNILNVLLVGDNATLNSNIMINHLSKLTNSDFSNYAIAQDNAVMVLNNNAKIIKGAAKSIVHQKAKGLTLSKTSKIKAMPNLYIDEYDVLASHSAAVGKVNDEHMYYLCSRGVSEEQAREFITMGYLLPVLDYFKDIDIREKAQKTLERRVSNV